METGLLVVGSEVRKFARTSKMTVEEATKDLERSGMIDRYGTAEVAAAVINRVDDAGRTNPCGVGGATSAAAESPKDARLRADFARNGIDVDSAMEGVRPARLNRRNASAETDADGLTAGEREAWSLMHPRQELTPAIARQLIEARAKWRN